MKKYFQALLTSLVLLLLVSFTGINETYAKTFNDVPENSSHAKDISRLAEMGIIGGYSNGNFGLKDPIKREHAVLMIYKLLKNDLKAVRPYVGFSDVPTTHKNYAAIKWGYEVGIIDGNSSGKFNPSNFVTREQMAKIIVSAFDLTTTEKNTFSDLSSKKWSYKYVNIMKANGLTVIANGKFNPTGDTKRGQMASFLIRTIDFKNGDAPVQSPDPEVKPQLPITKEYDSGFKFKWNAEETSTTLHLKGNLNNKVVGEFVKGAKKSLHGIKIGATQASVVTAKKGKFISVVQYKDGYYKVSLDNPATAQESIVFEENDKIVTVFLDKHLAYRVSAILSVDKAQYTAKNYHYTKSDRLKEDYEDLMVLLINQSRKEFAQNTVTNENDKWNFIARKHSKDMIDRKYFAHTSPDGKGLANRLTEGKLNYRFASENISYGHETVLHAHEAFMNSIGHRNNILNASPKSVFVGAEFSSKNVLYFTVNFFTLK